MEQTTLHIDSIEFRSHPIYKNLFGSEDGLVYNRSKDKLLRLTINHGYLRFRIPAEYGISKTMKVHRFIYEAWFYKLNSAGKQIDHIDRNKLNNRISNLREVSYFTNNLNRENKVGDFVDIIDETYVYFEKVEKSDGEVVELQKDRYFYSPVHKNCIIYDADTSDAYYLKNQPRNSVKLRDSENNQRELSLRSIDKSLRKQGLIVDDQNA